MKNCLFLVILLAVKSALMVMDVVTSASFWLVLTMFLSCLKVGWHSLNLNLLFVSYILWFFRKVWHVSSIAVLYKVVALPPKSSVLCLFIHPFLWTPGNYLSFYYLHSFSICQCHKVIRESWSMIEEFQTCFFQHAFKSLPCLSWASLVPQQ